MDYRRDLRSKLSDGLLPAVVLYLLAILAVMPVQIIGRFWGRPGLLVYLLGLLAVAMYSLQRALVHRYSEVIRAWYGMSGGLLAWAVIDLATGMENRPIYGPTPAILLIMASLITLLLWRPYLPVGARFFQAACLACGVRQMALFFIHSLSGGSPALQVFYLGLGIFSAAAGLLVLAWIFVFSEWQIQRMWAALAAALLALTAFAILAGGIF